MGKKWGVSDNQATERAIRKCYESLVEGSTNKEDEVVEEIRDQVEYLKGQLRVRDEEIRRRDHLMAAALERIPALEERSEAHRGDLRASEEDARGRGQEESADKPWWKVWTL